MINASASILHILVRFHLMLLGPNKETDQTTKIRKESVAAHFSSDIEGTRSIEYDDNMLCL
jgi:hypothetical protein